MDQEDLEKRDAPIPTVEYPNDQTSTAPASLRQVPTATGQDGQRQSLEATGTLSRVPSAIQPPSFSTFQEIVFVAIICSGQLLTQAGLAQSVAPVHIIVKSFNITNPGQLSWLTAAFSLTVGTFILPAGRWGDLYGHKLMFVAGYFWYSAWSIIAGLSVFSKTMIFFAFCRAMQGLGPALLLPNGIAILSRTYPPGPKQAMILSIFGATAPGGFVIGAAFSGIFAQLLWWPWAYFAMGIAAATAGVVAITFVPKMPVVGGKSTLAELDIWGSAVGVTGLILFNFAWNQGPAAGWSTIYVYVVLIIGVAFLGAFFWIEAKISSHPLLPTTAFSPVTGLVFGCIAAGWGSFGLWMYYFWQFLEVLRGQSVLLTAAQATPTVISGMMAAVTTGFLIGTLHVQPGIIMLASMTAFGVGLTLLATMPVNQTYWAQTFVSTLVTCWGMDMSFPSGVIVLSNHMPPEHQGLAASLVNTIVNYSISIGLGMGGTVEAYVNHGGKDLLRGYRGAWYLGIGLDVWGMILAVCLIVSWRATEHRKAREQEKVTESGELS